MSKYGNKKVVFMGEVFDSIAERDRWLELSLLQKAGKIRDLRRQVSFELVPKQSGERAVTYVADFVYDAETVKVAEDVKGMATRDYIIKRKLFKERYSDYGFSEICSGMPTKNSTFVLKVR
jgi:hypothetical protein